MYTYLLAGYLSYRVNYFESVIFCFIVCCRMVRTYARKSNRAGYGPAALRTAIDAINRGDLSKRKASIQYGIPRDTLIKRLKHPNNEPTSLRRYKLVFDEDFEKELCTHIIEMSNHFYGLPVTELRSLALELAERNSIDHPFNTSQRLAGFSWTSCFMKRHLQLSLRSLEATSLSRLAGFNDV